MDSINKLIQLFTEFPGIGPRQAKRFAYFLLTKPQSYLEELTTMISDIKKDMRVCTECYRFFTLKTSGIRDSTGSLCSICIDPSRDASLLMLVSRDIDLEAIERSRSYKGRYFVLGGTLPILEKNPEQKIRQRELLNFIERKGKTLREIILSLNATAEGENTTDYIKGLLSPLTEPSAIRLTILGRGLSTGTELEYSDADTIKNALKNRA